MIGRDSAGCLPSGLPFKRNRKFNDKKATPTKKPGPQQENARQN
jgi:hypothetical protein